MKFKIYILILLIPVSSLFADTHSDEILVPLDVLKHVEKGSSMSIACDIVKALVTDKQRKEIVSALDSDKEQKILQLKARSLVHALAYDMYKGALSELYEHDPFVTQEDFNIRKQQLSGSIACTIDKDLIAHNFYLAPQSKDLSGIRDRVTVNFVS